MWTASNIHVLKNTPSTGDSKLQLKNRIWCVDKIILSAVQMKPYSSTLLPPIFWPNLYRKSHHAATSPRKCGYRAFWGNWQWKWLPGMSFFTDQAMKTGGATVRFCHHCAADYFLSTPQAFVWIYFIKTNANKFVTVGRMQREKERSLKVCP